MADKKDSLSNSQTTGKGSGTKAVDKDSSCIPKITNAIGNKRLRKKEN